MLESYFSASPSWEALMKLHNCWTESKSSNGGAQVVLIPLKPEEKFPLISYMIEITWQWHERAEKGRTKTELRGEAKSWQPTDFGRVLEECESCLR